MLFDLSACGHLPAAPTAQVDAQAGWSIPGGEAVLKEAM